MKVLVTGATGTIGRRLVRALPDVRALSRSPEAASSKLGSVEVCGWDGSSPLDGRTFDGVDAVVHLAGEPVAAGRWTLAKKGAIAGSRVQSTRALVGSMRASAAPPRTLLCASAVGFYGDRGDEILDEASARGTGFLSEVCAAWEQAARGAEEFGVRVVIARFGIVLDRDGGALPRMVPAFRVGLGGPLGDGAQWMPWIHVDDVVGIVVFALEGGVSGVVNAVGPEPVRQVDFARALARCLGRPARVRTPRIALRLAFGEMADALLSSQRVLPARAKAGGYAFRHPDLSEALRDLLERRGALPASRGS